MIKKKHRFSSRFYEKLLILIVSFIILVVVLFILFIWQGGYWENWFLVDRMSGRKRFREYVADPIPDEIYNIYGGYSGFPKGQITTFFQYQGLISKQDFLNNWLYIDEKNNSVLYKIFADKMDVTRIYVYQDKNYERYLLIDDRKKTGILFVP